MLLYHFIPQFFQSCCRLEVFIAQLAYHLSENADLSGVSICDAPSCLLDEVSNG
jgi:energy-converting hydrogenase Eha subunit F